MTRHRIGVNGKLQAYRSSGLRTVAGSIPAGIEPHKLTVRISPEENTRLKLWAMANGITLDTAIRTLITRFVPNLTIAITEEGSTLAGHDQGPDLLGDGGPEARAAA